MIRLSRETRFALVPPDQIGDSESKNSWAGWPSTGLVVPQLTLQMIVSGVPDSQTGYLCNIKVIDDLFRQIIVESLIPTAAKATLSGGQLLAIVWELACEKWPEVVQRPSETIDQALPKLESVSLHLNKFLSLSAGNDFPRGDGDSMQVTQQFEFSAAHRLHCDSMSEEANRQLFGKCNNPNGHGHNYVVQVSVRGTDGNVDLLELERVVKTLVIDRLDHKHLNQDIEYFATVNPSVENIASAVFDWLQGQFGDAALERVRVYETPKTWAERSVN